MAVWGGLEVVWGGFVEVWGGFVEVWGGLGCFNGPIYFLVCASLGKAAL